MVRCEKCPVYNECKITDHEAIMWWRHHEGRKLPELAVPVALEMHRRAERIDLECPLLAIVNPGKYQSLSEKAKTEE